MSKIVYTLGFSSMVVGTLIVLVGIYLAITSDFDLIDNFLISVNILILGIGIAMIVIGTKILRNKNDKN